MKRLLTWLGSFFILGLAGLATVILTADIDVGGPMNLWPPPVIFFVLGYLMLLGLALVVWLFTKSKIIAVSLLLAGMLCFGYALYRDVRTPNSEEEAMLTPGYERYMLDVTFPPRVAFYSAYLFGSFYTLTGLILNTKSKGM